MLNDNNYQQSDGKENRPDFENWDEADFKRSSFYSIALHKILKLIKCSNCVLEVIAIFALVFVAIKADVLSVRIMSLFFIPALVLLEVVS